MIFLLLLYHVLIYKKENGTGLRLSLRIISECVQSYGENCKRSCSKDCVNQTCDRMTGICLNGCMDGTNCDQGIFFYISNHETYCYKANCPFLKRFFHLISAW